MVFILATKLISRKIVKILMKNRKGRRKTQKKDEGLE